jgi:acetylornithine deacetylase/succinyl-diaminopimelate desuccinylase-like protein
MQVHSTTQSLFNSMKVLDTLCEYVKIPNLSPSFDSNILTNGLQEKAVKVMVDWVQNVVMGQHFVKGVKYQVVTLPGKTPLIFITVDPFNTTCSDTVLMYGHLDKQPPFVGWMEGLDPYKPVIRDGKLYGRGGADDGYAIFAALTSLATIQREGLSHSRIVILIEASEESGSPDLPFYIEHLKNEIGTPGLLVCLDSGAGSYDQLWVTTSLRGILVANLKVTILKEGVHSGDASGVVPSSFRIARQLLSRLEDEITGEIKPNELKPLELTEARIKAASEAAETLGKAGFIDVFPFIPGAKPVQHNKIGELALNRWWKPQLEIIGADGLPPSSTSGNVLRPFTTLTLSLRLPPTLPTSQAEACVKSLLEKDPPYGAKVEVDIWKCSQGWSAPPMESWLLDSMNGASQMVFGKPAVLHGEGGSIPFIAMLGRLFPQCAFMVTGVLGPGANAHGPNEFLHIDFTQRITSCVAKCIVDFTQHRSKSSSAAATATAATTTTTISSMGNDTKRTRVDDNSPEKLKESFTRNKDGSKV